MMEPTGLGDEPHVRTTVAINARWPAARQPHSVRKTMTSRFSIVRSTPQVPGVHCQQRQMHAAMR